MTWRRQLFRFATMGAIGTALHYALLVVLVSGFGHSAHVATMAGAAVGAIANYLLNYHFTFASTRSHRQALPRFLAMAAAGVLLNGVIVGFIVVLEFDYLLAQVIATITILAINFLVSRKWIFYKTR